MNQRIRKKEKVKHRIAYMGSKGWGFITLEDIPVGGLVGEYIGEVLNDEEKKRRLKEDYIRNQNFYLLELGGNLCLDATRKGAVTRFINHSCNPNARTEKWRVDGNLRIAIIAIKKIPAGTEVSFDYQYERAGSKKQQCYCGEPNCRGSLGAKVPKRGSVEFVDLGRDESLVDQSFIDAAPAPIEEVDDFYDPMKEFVAQTRCIFDGPDGCSGSESAVRREDSDEMKQRSNDSTRSGGGMGDSGGVQSSPPRKRHRHPGRRHKPPGSRILRSDSRKTNSDKTGSLEENNDAGSNDPGSSLNDGGGGVNKSESEQFSDSDKRADGQEQDTYSEGDEKQEDHTYRKNSEELPLFLNRNLEFVRKHLAMELHFELDLKYGDKSVERFTCLNDQVLFNLPLSEVFQAENHVSEDSFTDLQDAAGETPGNDPYDDKSEQRCEPSVEDDTNAVDDDNNDSNSNDLSLESDETIKHSVRVLRVLVLRDLLKIMKNLGKVKKHGSKDIMPWSDLEKGKIPLKGWPLKGRPSYRQFQRLTREEMVSVYRSLPRMFAWNKPSSAVKQESAVRGNERVEEHAVPKKPCVQPTLKLRLELPAKKGVSKSSS
uniref:Histone-lysine N-methyltransferase n=1 Tax=Lotharella globosa TaxID=91324 RepID=A0A7S3Y9Z1_9EUKA|mmetsp:Transcript_11170/g.21562  ORF Transcript_11170/g.21562 Transcript_11170/m.21562 type:complete len:599 (+) Transcript_11170:516-2312(+)